MVLVGGLAASHLASGVIAGADGGGSGSATYSQQVEPFEALARDDGHGLHLAEERDLGGQEAHGVRECHCGGVADVQSPPQELRWWDACRRVSRRANWGEFTLVPDVRSVLGPVVLFTGFILHKYLETRYLKDGGIVPSVSRF